MNFIYRKMPVWRRSLGRTVGESVNSTGYPEVEEPIRAKNTFNVLVYSYFKNGCQREWRKANVDRRLHDRKELWLRYFICKIS